MSAPRLIAASLFAVTAGRAAQASDPGAIVADACSAANAADNQRVDQRLAVWASLKAAQKASFARPERAWLNGSRTEEERCLANVPAPTPLAEHTCRLEVTEPHFILTAPIAQASAHR
jgi:hypothetical protein